MRPSLVHRAIGEIDPRHREGLAEGRLEVLECIRKAAAAREAAASDSPPGRLPRASRLGDILVMPEELARPVLDAAPGGFDAPPHAALVGRPARDARDGVDVVTEELPASA